MANARFQRVPSEIIPVAIASTGADTIEIAPAVSGYRVVVCRYQLAGGTSVTWKDGANTMGGTLTTSGIAAAGVNVSTPGIDAALFIPEWESSTGNSLSVVAGASGLGGTVWYAYVKA